MRETLKGLVAAVAWSALWILPLPFGTFVSDRIFFTSLSPLLLGVLILTVPPWLRRRDTSFREVRVPVYRVTDLCDRCVTPFRNGLFRSAKKHGFLAILSLQSRRVYVVDDSGTHGASCYGSYLFSMA